MRNNDLYKKQDDRSNDASRKRDVRPDGATRASDIRSDYSTGASNIRPEDADSVLAAFEDALAGGGDPGLLLKEWVKLYPAHRTDLALATSEFSARTLEEARSGEEIPDSLIEKVVAEVPIPPGAIQEQARRSGIAFPEELAALLRVSPVFLERLQRYEIDSGTIPKLFSTRMAEILKIPIRECVRMLLGTLQFKPSIGEGIRADQVSFAQALRESCSPEDIEHWFGESS